MTAIALDQLAAAPQRLRPALVALGLALAGGIAAVLIIATRAIT